MYGKNVARFPVGTLAARFSWDLFRLYQHPLVAHQQVSRPSVLTRPRVLVRYHELRLSTVTALRSLAA